MSKDVNTSDPSSTDDQNRELSNSHLDTDLHEDPAVLKLVDSFASEEDNPDLKVITIGQDEVPARELEGDPETESKDTDEATDKDDPETEIETEATPTKTKVKGSSTGSEEIDDSYPTDEEVEGYTHNSQKRIRQLVAARKRSEEQLADYEADADYKRQLDSTLEQLGASKPAWDNWVQLGFLLQKGASEVPDILRQMANNLDTDAGRQVKAQPAAAASSAVLDDDLQAYVDSLQMSEDAAVMVQGERAKSRNPTHQQQPQQQAASVGPRLSESDIEYGDRAIAKVNDEYAAKYPSEWNKLIPEVHKEMAKYAGTSPRQWGKIARDAVEKVIGRHKGKVSSTPDPVTRSSGKGAKKSSTAFDSKEDFVDSMLSGKLFSS